MTITMATAPTVALAVCEVGEGLLRSPSSTLILELGKGRSFRQPFALNEPELGVGKMSERPLACTRANPSPSPWAPWRSICLRLNFRGLRNLEH
jgi:hypothetical protein